MSDFRGHRLGGIVGSTLVMGAGTVLTLKFGYNFGIPHILAAGTSTLFFSLFPDIDIKSTPSRMFYFALLVVFGVLYYFRQWELANIIAIFSCIPQITQHRGLFHSKLTALTIPAYIFALSNYYHFISFQTACLIYSAGVVGYFTHLLLDSGD